MTHEEYIMYLDKSVKDMQHSIELLCLSDDKNIDSIGRVIKMLKMVKDDLDNIFVRLDKLEEYTLILEEVKTDG